MFFSQTNIDAKILKVHTLQLSEIKKKYRTRLVRILIMIMVVFSILMQGRLHNNFGNNTLSLGNGII